MKQQTIKKRLSGIITSTILISTLTTAVSQAQVCNNQPNSPMAPAINTLVTQTSQAPYSQDLLSQCNNYVMDLNISLQKANSVARFGQLSKASDILSQAIFDKEASLPLPNVDYLYPHTVEAIRAAAEVVRATISSTTKIKNSGTPNQIGQLRYIMFSSLIQMINSAYHDLDEVYFMNAFRSCYNGCFPFPGDFRSVLPLAYYDGVRELAFKIISLQQYLGQLQGYDVVEIEISGAIVKSAKNILLGSIFRRDLSCVINQLYYLEQTINDYMNCGSQNIPTQYQVQEIRIGINSIAQALRQQARTCGYGPFNKN